MPKTEEKNLGGKSSEANEDGVVEIDWGFWAEEIPDFRKSPIEKIQDWLKTLKDFIPEEKIGQLMDKILQLRQKDSP